MQKMDKGIELQLKHAVGQFAKGRTDQAIAIFQTIIGNRRCLSSLLHGLGSIADQKGFYERRVPLWYQEEINANRLSVNHYDGLALCYSVNRKFQEAEFYYQNLLIEHPNDDGLRLGLAHVYHNQGRVRQAISEYQKVEGSIAKHHLAMLALQQGDLQTAKIHLESIKDKSKSFSGGLMAAMISPQEERLKGLEKFTNDQPKYARAFLVLGAELQRRGKSEQALAAYQQATKKDSKYSAALRKLAQLHSKLQHRKEALTISEKLVQIDNLNVLNCLQYAIQLLACGRLNEGQKALQNVIKVLEYRIISLEKANYDFLLKQIVDSLAAVRKEKMAPNNYEWKCEILALTQFNSSLQSQWEEHLNITLSKLRLNNPKLNNIITLLSKNSFRLDENTLLKQIFTLYSKQEGYLQAVGVACCQYANKKLQEGLSNLQIEKDLRQQLNYEWSKSVKSEISQQIPYDPDYKKLEYPILHTGKKYDMFKAQFYSSYNHLVLALKKISKKAKMTVSGLQDFLKGLKTSADGFEQSIKCKVTPYNECSAINSIILEILPEAAKNRQKLLQVAQPGLSLPIILQNMMEIWKDEVTNILKERTRNKETTHCFVDDWIQIQCHFASQTRTMMAVKQLESQCKKRNYEIIDFDGKLEDRNEEAVIFKIRVDGVGCKVRLAVHRQSKLRKFQQQLSNMVNNPMGPLFSSLLSLTTKNEVSFLNHCRQLQQQSTDRNLSIQLKEIVNQLEDPQLLDIQGDDMRESSTTIRRVHLKTEASEEGRGFQSLGKRVKTLNSERYEDENDEEPPVSHWGKNRRFSYYDEQQGDEDMRKTAKYQQFKHPRQRQRPDTLRSSEIIYNKEYYEIGENESEQNFILDITSPQKNEIELQRQRLIAEKFTREDSWEKERELLNTDIKEKQALIEQLSHELNQKQDQFAEKQKSYKVQIDETIEELDKVKLELQRYREDFDYKRIELSKLKHENSQIKALLAKNAENQFLREEVWLQKIRVLNQQLQRANKTVEQQRSLLNLERQQLDIKAASHERNLQYTKEEHEKEKKNLYQSLRQAEERVSIMEKKQNVLLQDKQSLEKKVHITKAELTKRQQQIEQVKSRQNHHLEEIKRLNEQITRENQLSLENKLHYDTQKSTSQHKIASLLEKIQELKGKNEDLSQQLKQLSKSHEKLKNERNQMNEMKSSMKKIVDDRKKREEQWSKSEKKLNQKIKDLEQAQEQWNKRQTEWYQGQIQWKQRQLAWSQRQIDLKNQQNELKQWKLKQAQWKQRQNDWIQKQMHWRQIEEQTALTEKNWKKVMEERDQRQKSLLDKIEDLQAETQIYLPKDYKAGKTFKELDATSDFRTSPLASPKAMLDNTIFSHKSTPSKHKNKGNEIGIQSMTSLPTDQGEPLAQPRCLCRGRLKQVSQMRRSLQNYKLIFVILTLLTLSVSFSVRLLK